MQRVLIVDDSPVIRRLLGDMIGGEPDLEVVGYAPDGEEAVAKVRELRPDVVTMDVEMPRCTGLEALRRIMAESPVPVLMVSSLTRSGARETIEALQCGAFDVVAKPALGPAEFPRVREELIQKIRLARFAQVKAPVAAPSRPPSKPSLEGVDGSRIVLIASSTGGPRALTMLFERLPSGFPAPILLVQHMPPGFTESLALRLGRVGPIHCREARDAEHPAPGEALIAPGGRHLVVDSGGTLRLEDGPTVHGVRPSADRLFLSAATHYGSRCLALVLTGMGRDGAEGAQALRAAGATVFGEAESTCTIYGMPRAAKAVGGIDAEFPIHDMADALVRAMRGARAA
ncbi:MAG: chemotaxis response regulator protein-glutamate methylesterase [Fimbriimonadaceae bacterium]|nr:chemotaxis response regulator protein-glutamate methylesterase [Chthonomonadaceae bacterium]MCO5295852.1 chemotaxis response regulator protein-glutamate methylesterase [Fimbriimonadaceae bacterium]